MHALRKKQMVSSSLFLQFGFKLIDIYSLKFFLKLLFIVVTVF